MIDSNNFNTDIILNEIDLVIKKGVNKILKDYMNRYNLLERTHKQIMQLPSVLNELNKSSDKLSVNDSSDDESDDVPIFVSIADMTKNLVTEEVNAIEKKIANLEKKYDLILPIFEKILKKIDDLNADVKYIKKSSTSEVKVIKYNNKTVETKENIKLEMQEEESADEQLSDEKEEEAEEKEEPVEEEDKDEDEDEEDEDQEDEKDEDDKKEVETESEDDKKEDETESEDETEDEDDKEEDDKDENDEDEDNKEEDEKEDDKEEVDDKDEDEDDKEEDETEAEDDKEEVETESEDDEEEVETEAENDKEKDEKEEEEELFEIEIDGTTYCTNNEESGLIFELTEDGDVGEKVGYLKEGEPFFYANEK